MRPGAVRPAGTVPVSAASYCDAVSGRDTANQAQSVGEMHGAYLQVRSALHRLAHYVAAHSPEAASVVAHQLAGEPEVPAAIASQYVAEAIRSRESRSTREV